MNGQDRWARVKELFLEVIREPVEVRADVLRRACPGDPELTREVQELIDGDPHFQEFDENPSALLGLPEPAPHIDRPATFPQRIGDFQVRTLLGSGSAGLVYLAVSARTGAPAAIKVLRSSDASPMMRRRFALEPEILSRLEHPGIARVVSTGTLSEPDGRPYFVSDYIEGKPIIEFASERGLSIEQRIALVLRVCEAVQHAHSRGVIHRDLKPANILVTRDGRPVVLDFGVARLLGPVGPRATVATLLGQVVGTLAYMAPEQVTSAGATTGGDVYSLGAILYELLGGRPPLELSDAFLPEAVLRVRDHKPARLSTLNPACRGDLETVAHAALEKDPERRYGAVAEFAADLRRVLGRQPVSARPPSLVYEGSMFIRRHRWATLLACILGVVVLAAAAVLERSFRQTQESRAAVRSASKALSAGLSRLGPLTAASDARRAVVDIWTGSLERLALDNPLDEQLQLSYARVLDARADLALEETRHQEAVDIRRQLLRRLQPLADRPGASLDIRAARSIAAVKLGNLLGDLGSHDEATSLYEESLRIDRDLAAAYPLDPSILDQLTWSYERVSERCLSLGDTSRALELSSLRIRACEQLLALDPARVESLYAAVCADNVDRKIRIHTGASRRSPQEWEEILGRVRDLVHRRPDDRGYQTLYIQSLLNSADEAVVAGFTAQSERYLDEAQPLIDRFLKTDPSDTRALLVAGRAERSRIFMLWGSPDRTAVLPHIHSVMDLARRRLELNPSGGDSVAEYAADVRDMVWRLNALGDLSAARSLHSSLVAMLIPFTEAPRRTPGAMEHLAGILLECPFPDLADPAMAERTASALARWFPRRASYWLLLAQAQVAAGHEVDAAASASKAAELATGADVHVGSDAQALMKQLSSTHRPQ